MARRNPFQGRIGGQQGLVEHDLAILPTEAAEAGFLPVADGQQVARHLADAKHAAGLGGFLGHKPRLGGGLHEERLDDLRHQPPLLGLGRFADDGREVESFLARPSRATFGNRAEAIGADVADDAILDLVFVGNAGVHVAEQLFQLVRGKHRADDVEHLVGAQFAADLLEPFEQLLQDAALAGVLGDEVEDQAVLFLAVTVDAADALFQADGIPGDVEVDHHPAELQVDAFAGGLGRDEYLGRFLELALGIDARARRVAIADLHAAVDLRERQAPLAQFSDRAVLAAVARQVVEGVLVLGEDEQPHLGVVEDALFVQARSGAC